MTVEVRLPPDHDGGQRVVVHGNADYFHVDKGHLLTIMVGSCPCAVYAPGAWCAVWESKPVTEKPTP